MKKISDNTLDISYHRVTNKIDDSFVGLKIRNDRIDFYYPETYEFNNNASIEDNRNDILAILNTIAIAKTLSSSDAKIESSYSNNNALPLLSYLWIIRDYLINGIYVNREKILKQNQKGRVDWKRTLNGQPIISNGNVIYKDITVSIKNELDNIIVDIHKYCIKKSIDLLGWLFRINNSNFIDTKPFIKGMKFQYREALRKELHQTFDDIKKLRLTHMLTIIEGLSEDNETEEIVYGVDKYAFIFEKMINSIFGNKEASKYNPSANWFFEEDGFKDKFKSSDLRPDTILTYENNTYILDSKFYRFGYTADKGELPETSSIQKQVTYGDYVKNNKLIDTNRIRNAFIMPYNKYNNKLKFNNNLEYIGFARPDYREGKDAHEVIHAFLIDLKYVINTWNSRNHGIDIITLVTKIEEVQKKITNCNNFNNSH